jgi:hypothetical protein
VYNNGYYNKTNGKRQNTKMETISYEFAPTTNQAILEVDQLLAEM